MKILVTGGAGYLGSVLVPKLVSRGHEVRVFDGGYFGFRHLKRLLKKIDFIRGDLREILTKKTYAAKLLKDCDVVIHLAALSNDPSADLNKELTDQINVQVTKRLAEEAKKQHVKFIFSSSCAVYGSTNRIIRETSKLVPVTTYARSKVKAEKAVLSMVTKSWRPIILRNGTLFGLSPKMRFDVVINIFSLLSALHSQVKVFGSGIHWRPFLHVKDCANAFIFFAEKKSCEHLIYNLGHQNMTVNDLVPIFKKLNPKLRVEQIALPREDHRNYRVATR